MKSPSREVTTNPARIVLLLIALAIGLGLTGLLFWLTGSGVSPSQTTGGNLATDKSLDRPDVLRVLFHPRRESSSSPAAGIRRVSVEVEPGIFVGGRLYVAGETAPVILYFHGNGEIAADYDNIALLYTRLGLSLLVMDYRGYGLSDGTSTGSNLLADAVTIFETLDEIFAEYNLRPARVYVMGRSLGSASAIEAADRAGDQLAGLIVESGFADTFALVARLGGPNIKAGNGQSGFDNGAKISRITIPTLIIHGAADYLISPDEGQALYQHSVAADKQLVLIPGAGHNDLLLVGPEQYFEAIGAFCGFGNAK